VFGFSFAVPENQVAVPEKTYFYETVTTGWKFRELFSDQ
jgi:hypothetical protein